MSADLRPLTERIKPFTLDESVREPAPPLSYQERVTVARFAGRPDAFARCTEAEQRAAMSDDDFWAHVFDEPGFFEPDPDAGPLDPPALSSEPCPECTSVGACAWDAEGRPLIHALAGDRDE